MLISASSGRRRESLARAGHHRLEAARLGNRLAADVEGMDDRRRAGERGIVVEAEARHQGLEGHALADVGEGRAVEVEAERALRTFRGAASQRKRASGR